MSFKALSWAWEANTGSPGRKLVLVGLAQFANDKNECWPSQATIADRTEQSERTVREHLAWLEEKGFLSRQARNTAGKQYDSDIIRLHLDRLEPRANEERNPAADFAAGENAPTDPVETAPSGEKPHEPAADFAEIQRQISPPNLQGESPIESPTTPLTPKRGKRGKVRREIEISKVDQFDHLVPLWFQTEPFMAKWREYVGLRIRMTRENRAKPITALAAETRLKMLEREAKEPDVAIPWIQRSIDNSWTGIFPDKVAPKAGFSGSPSRPSPRDQLNTELRAQLANRGRAQRNDANPIF